MSYTQNVYIQHFAPFLVFNVQRLRNLENRLDKSNLKCKEAEHIRKTYVQIKSKLEDEHKTFENSLDDMEQDIRRYLNTQILDLVCFFPSQLENRSMSLY